LNISYPDELLEAFESWDRNFVSIGFQPDLPNSIRDKIVDQPVPYMFARYQVESSFLINFWQVFSVLMIVTLIFGVMRFFEHVSKKLKSKYLPLSYCKAVRVTGQNFLLTQLYSVFGDLIFYSILEWRSVDVKTDYSWMSLSIAAFLFSVMFLVFFVHTKLILNYQRIKKKSAKLTTSKELDDFTNSYEGCEVLYRDFKDDSIFQQGFLFFFTLRDIALSLIFTTLFLHPLTQATLIFVQNLAMILYLIIQKPFSSKIDLVQQIVFEVFIFFVNTSVFIMAILDKFECEALTVRNRLGKGIIIICMVFSFVVLGFVLMKLLVSAKYGYDAWKAYRKKKKMKKTTKRLQSNSQNISQDPSIFLSEDITNIHHISRENSMRQGFNQSQISTDHQRKQTEVDLINDELSSSRKRIKNESQTMTTTQASLLENSLANIYDNFDEKLKRINSVNMRIHPTPIRTNFAANNGNKVNNPTEEKPNKRLIVKQPEYPKVSLEDKLRAFYTINSINTTTVNVNKKLSFPTTTHVPPLKLAELAELVNKKSSTNQEKVKPFEIARFGTFSQMDKKEVKRENSSILSLDLSPIKLTYTANPKKKFEFQ